ncbi:carboxymuconolactone decarboxylase family protein [Brachyspira hyodysenteriae]|uniref:carboxymuconolactone decarboxylase family protein n=1 Tax=Brachyspira hyodysenteriae TaxID=159 RepID=UPI00063D969C|nr:carboxymuconolactone decarboxylase family protein [Brachyspira hyodysenteriae]KLI32947.1 4-carboxymuconolactone decarboxylase [Brachyspira hyodysenteriae]KLI59614.1 4-carboxymuconolactone decarboxylase [Brachyspira hyodysenteriae]MCZ9838639.1 carboxymuconolactone decarboxylase family protein [Brachyspira hyodysenteriae]MCZ9847942.1 carboxymuconolactone decarboxylase family protein [Brachyspira hyodysenteriae]MCZ9851633.1 carboxymuconolactone decarboxylase family protein [Brachyspira hyodyse
MKKSLKIILSLSILVIVFSCIANSQSKGESLTMTEKAKNKYNELLKRDASITKTNDADLESIFNNFLYADVYNHGTLDPKLRELVTLVSLTASQGTDMIKDHVEIALNVGASPIEIKEALYQCSPYVGFPRVFAALEKANEVFKEKNISLPIESQSTVTEQTRFDKGLETQVSIFGDAIHAAHSNAAPNQKHIQNFLSANCFGDFYTRTGLDLKTRELLTFIMLISLGGAEPQATAHANANISMGNTKDMMLEAVTQCLPFIGYPRTLNAIAIINNLK